MPLIAFSPFKLLSVLYSKLFSTWSTTELYGSLTNSNLTITTGNNLRGGRSVIGVTTGKHYWEVTLVDIKGWGMIGIGTSTANNSIPPYNSRDAIVCFDGSFYGGGAILLGGSFLISNGMVLGFALDADSRHLDVYANGVFKARLSFEISLTQPIYALACVGNYNTGAIFTANFGASQFQYPVPAGFNEGLYSAIGNAYISLFAQAGSGNDTIAYPSIQARKGQNQFSGNTATSYATAFPISFVGNTATTGSSVKIDFNCLSTEQDAIIAACGSIIMDGQTPSPFFTTYFPVLNTQKRFRLDRSGLNCTLNLVE